MLKKTSLREDFQFERYFSTHVETATEKFLFWGESRCVPFIPNFGWEFQTATFNDQRFLRFFWCNSRSYLLRPHPKNSVKWGMTVFQGISNPFQQFVQKILPLNRWNPKSYFFKVPFPQKKTFGPFFETIESIGNLDEIWVLWRNQSQNFPSDPPGWCRARQVLQP